MATQNDAKITAVFGQSGVGKGMWLKSWLKPIDKKRIIIIDPMDEYGDIAKPVSSCADLARAVVNEKSFAVRYVFPRYASDEVMKKAFDFSCILAYESGNVTFLVEELSLFTSATSAPPRWREVCNRGRHQGLHVIGCSQFPAQVDMGFRTNATLIHTGALASDAHRKSVSQCMDINPAIIKSLEKFEFIEWSQKTRQICRGRINPDTRKITQKPL